MFVEWLRRRRVVVLLIHGTLAWRVARPWTEKHWCASVVEPEWPFAYEKYAGQAWERKGRTNSDTQDVRHECATFGVESKCHRCEEISCGNATCSYQLQGVGPKNSSVNVATASDSPWAVNGSHRYDFGGASHVCVILSGANCTSPIGDVSGCATRCWGSGEGPATPRAHLEAAYYEDGSDNEDRYRTVDGESSVATDAWEYKRRPTAQGEVWTVAGAPMRTGFRDGIAALFNEPSGVAIDADGHIYIADAMNHAVRVVNATTGEVATLAGAAPPIPEAGHVDGPAAEARFSAPRGVAVAYEGGDWGNRAKLEVYVADTGNHRIRKITGVALGRDGATVECFAGRCGNGTVAKDATKFPADPEPGFADGRGAWARFDAPRGLAVHGPSGDVVVADTNNHLIRIINATRFVFTLAGEVAVAETGEDGAPLPGCAPPCLAGVEGARDGNASVARFHYPKAVAIDDVSSLRYSRTNGRYTVVVSDGVRVRRVIPAAGWWHTTHEFDGDVVSEGGQVVTLAGGVTGGRRDGSGDDATFEQPAGIVVAGNGHAYVADRGACRIRRVSPPRLVAANVSRIFAPDACGARLVDLLRPDGCAMYDPPVGARDLKMTARVGHIHYNYASRFVNAPREPGRFAETDEPEPIGRAMKNCVGSPPPDRRDKVSWMTGRNLVVDDLEWDVDEDTGQGTTLHLRCPAGCLTAATRPVYGAPPGYFADESPICAAAAFVGAFDDDLGGAVTVELLHGAIARTRTNQSTFDDGYGNSSTLNVEPLARVFGTWPRGPLLVERLFSVRAFLDSDRFEVQTIAGAAAAPLESPCGFRDGFPPQDTAFDAPAGLALTSGTSMSHNETLVVADTQNHVIRRLTAVCSAPCENGGHCVAPETCACREGWSGSDCATPICTANATLMDSATVGCQSSRTVCVAPETCACAPGWSGDDCLTPLCVQDCRDGSCVAPDTCGCEPGWFDANCTTPVCNQTCGNGGNCTAPDTCSCPSEWTGRDCREPVCHQVCNNGGMCIAPDTCQCPPQWHGYDCGLPVCHQGFFVPEADGPRFWPTYRPCGFQAWCNATNGFDCAQTRRAIPIEVPSGGEWRAVTGRGERPDRCDTVEIREDASTLFQYIDDNTTTRFARYAPLAPYPWDARSGPWRAYSGPSDGGPARTRPWNRESDRQVARVEWHNATQGVYVCANGGNCTAPDVCVCAPGWIGFDCRTPVCEQGYYNADQTNFVSGTEDTNEVAYFETFLDPNMSDYRLQWPYSNPDFVLVEEAFDGYDAVSRGAVTHAGVPYKGQGGYRCSIRAYTQWERPGFVFDHVNFFSRYMDSAIQADDNQYTFWTDMSWPPTHNKTAKLELLHELPTGDVVYVYTNEGHRRDGIWYTTGKPWQEGTCIVEFRRVCEDGSTNAFVEAASALAPKSGARLGDVAVQDTDLAYRPRVEYDDFRASGHGRWMPDDQCVDTVLRGCYNNGTCVAPNVCECARGWTGRDCSVPVCSQTCMHHGNCTGPDVCTCERGWDGFDCSIPVCAQECYHNGECVAPDTCRCVQWESEWQSGHNVPLPLFRKPNGDPQLTGWTGFDCSVPICTQAKRFLPNVGPAEDIRDAMAAEVNVYASSYATSYAPLRYRELGGRGFDGREDVVVDGELRLKCDAKPRCPSYDNMVSANVGETWPQACGFDVLETGCCVRNYDDVDDDDIVAAIVADPASYREYGTYTCQYCPTSARQSTDNTFTCDVASMIDGGDDAVLSTKATYDYADVPDRYRHGWIDDIQVRICGTTDYQMNFKREFYRRPDYNDYKPNDPKPNLTSALFLCGLTEWVQGDYIDDAGLCTKSGDCTAARGTGIEYGDEYAVDRFESGRHVRVNTPNITSIDGDDTWQYGSVVRGEGIYECHNGGTCISPDVCTCMDGWSGFDCKTPLCRHLQHPSGTIAGCMNGGVCSDKDTCTCIQAPSVLKHTYNGAPGGITGWTGTDCTMPICVQGAFDPFCTDLPQAPGGEGCYRCANGGNCTAPDTCTCAEGWQGYDCRTPVCEVVATPLQRRQLHTLDEDKIDLFEKNPCTMLGIYDPEPIPASYSGEGPGGYLAVRGNCTAPNECTCWCKNSYSERICHRKEEKGTSTNECKGPFQDLLGSPLFTGMDLVNYRNLLEPYETFGTRACRRGYEGTVNQTYDRFMSCHLRIFTPTVWEAWTITFIIVSSVCGIVAAVLYVYVYRKIKTKYLQAKIERRRSRRGSEDSLEGTRQKFARGRR